MRAAIRRFVLATSVPPLLNAYRAAYGVVARGAVRLFRRYHAVRAIYLCRGGARGSILPLVSDLDFTLITDGMIAQDREELLAAYATLARRTTILDRVLELHEASALREKYVANDYYRYRFTEGRASWRLLFGRDYLAELPPAPPESMTGPYLGELRVWWGLFAQRLLQGQRYEHEIVPRNAICYKAVAEALRMIVATETGRLPEGRGAALGASRAILGEADRMVVARLERLAERRFRPRDDAIVDDSLALLLRVIDAFFARFGTRHPRARGDAGVGMRIDFGGATAPGWRRAEALARRVAGELPGLSPARLAPAIYTSVDEPVLLAEVDPSRPPDAATLRRANALLDTEPAIGRAPLFLHLPNAAFRIDGRDPTKSWQSIFTPSMNPEVFALLGQSAPAWTPAVAQFVRSERALFAELLRDPAIYKVEDLEFLRIFWKLAQLTLAERSEGNGEVRYAMTPEAIARGLAEIAHPLPDALAPLIGGFAALAEGRDARAPDLRPLRARAIAALEALSAPDPAPRS